MQTRLYITDSNNITSQEMLDKIIDKLPDWRRNRVTSLKNINARRLSAAAGYLLCHALSQAGLDPYSAALSTGTNGKPVIDGCTSLFFNLSHSGSKAICIIGETENGCDIELIKEYHQPIVNRFYAQGEIEYLSTCNEEERTKAFYRLWTLKESFMKVTGLGMSLPLNEFTIKLADNISVSQNVDNRAYYFREFNLKDYCCSCCIADNPDGLPDRIEEIAIM